MRTRGPILMPSGLYDPARGIPELEYVPPGLDRGWYIALRDRVATLALRASRSADLAARRHAASLRARDPLLADVLALARSPLPTFEDAAEERPVDEGLPEDWLTANAMDEELARIASVTAAAGPAGWSIPAPEEILPIDCEGTLVAAAARRARRVRDRATRSGRSRQRREAALTACAARLASTQRPPTPAYRGVGRVRVNVRERHVLDRRGRRVPGVDVLEDGTLRPRQRSANRSTSR